MSATTMMTKSVAALTASARYRLRRAGGRAWRGTTWFVSGVLGADKYQRYLEHHDRTTCTSEPLSEREFWREHTDRLERDPQTRCC